MEECNVENFDIIAAEIKNSLSNSQELISHANSNYPVLRQSLNLEVINFCMHRYIQAELDSRTPGNRGLGRMTTGIPRFAAYMRKHISILSEKDISELYRLIQDLMINGYLIHALFIENPIKKPSLSRGKTLYERWIPEIYVGNLSKMSRSVSDLFEVGPGPPFIRLQAFLDAHNLKGGGFLSLDKTELITFYYPIAGFALRAAEVFVPKP